MGFFDVQSIGGAAKLWSDDTYTLHFGEGFDDQVESTPEMLADAVSAQSLIDILRSEDADQNDRAKAFAALKVIPIDPNSEVPLYDAEYDVIRHEPRSLWHADDGNAEITGEFESGYEAAKDYVETGEWDDRSETSRVTVHVWQEVVDADGDIVRLNEESHAITLEPDEPKCTENGHDWQSPHEIVGGIKENPGVWGHGGGVKVHEVCLHCGCERVRDTWAQDSNTGRQGLESVAYHPGKYANEVGAFRAADEG